MVCIAARAAAAWVGGSVVVVWLLWLVLYGGVVVLLCVFVSLLLGSLWVVLRLCVLATGPF